MRVGLHNAREFISRDLYSAIEKGKDRKLRGNLGSTKQRGFIMIHIALILVTSTSSLVNQYTPLVLF